MAPNRPLTMKTRARRCAILTVALACALLVGCNEDEDKAATTPPKSSSVIAKDLYDFEPAPPPPPVPPPPPPAEVPPAIVAEPKFEDPGPLLRAMQVRDLRAARQEAAAVGGLRQFSQSVDRASIDAAWRLK